MNSLSPRTSSSTTKLKRISTRQLRPGMFLVRILDSWWKSPFFLHRRMLKSSEEVQQLMSSGIQEVEIDIAQGLDVSSDSETEWSVENPQVEEKIEASSLHHDSDSQVSNALDARAESSEEEPQERLAKVCEDARAAVEGAFEGVKTGQPISSLALYTTAQDLVQNALAHPVLLAEIMLLDSLQRFDQTLYAHVVDTAVYSILVGMELGWEVKHLEDVAVGALLHDVGYIRLPKNMVQAQWRGTQVELPILQQHVRIGAVLLQNNRQFPPEILQMVKEHHQYQDGSGYSQGLSGELVSMPGQLLGLVDYFDELIAGGGDPGGFSPALAIRRIYQEAQKGKFSTKIIEAMIRILGVFPVGTLVQLSSGEQAVVVKQNPEGSVKPHVKIIRGPKGEMLDEPLMKTLALENENDVSIKQILSSTGSNINLREYF